MICHRSFAIPSGVNPNFPSNSVANRANDAGGSTASSIRARRATAYKSPSDHANACGNAHAHSHHAAPALPSAYGHTGAGNPRPDARKRVVGIVGALRRRDSGFGNGPGTTNHLP